MNFLFFKIAEHFGKELLKTVAIVAATTVAAEVAMKLAERAFPDAAEPETQAPDTSGGDVLLSDLLGGNQAPAAPPVHVNVVVNSYNDKSASSQEGCTNVNGSVEPVDSCCDGEGCDECDA